MIADAIGAPAECELTQISSSQNETAMVIGQAVNARFVPRLDIFKGDIIDPFASAKWMAEILAICMQLGLMSISSARISRARMRA